MMHKLAMGHEPIALVFSAREGNCLDFACQIIHRQNVFLLGMMDIMPCHGCRYECMNGACCPLKDDVGTIYRSWRQASSIAMFVPVYDGRPPALFYSLLERLPGLWNRHLEGFEFFLKPVALVAVGNQGTQETLAITSGILKDYGCSIIGMTAIIPSGLKTGGGISGGLVKNREIQELLAKTRKLL